MDLQEMSCLALCVQPLVNILGSTLAPSFLTGPTNLGPRSKLYLLRNDENCSEQKMLDLHGHRLLESIGWNLPEMFEGLGGCSLSSNTL